MKNFCLLIIFLSIGGCTHHEVHIVPALSKIKKVSVSVRKPASIVVIDREDEWLAELIDYERYHRLKRSSIPYTLIEQELEVLRGDSDLQNENLLKYINERVRIGGVYKSSCSHNILAQVFFGNYETWIFLLERQGEYDLELGRVKTDHR